MVDEALAQPGDSSQVVTEVIASLARLGLLHNSPNSFDSHVIAALARYINKTMSTGAEARVGKQREAPQEARLGG